MIKLVDDAMVALGIDKKLVEMRAEDEQRAASRANGYDLDDIMDQFHRGELG